MPVSQRDAVIAPPAPRASSEKAHEVVARVTQTLVAGFDSTRLDSVRALLRPIDTGAGRIDQGEVARRIDALMDATMWAYEGKIWASQAKEEWESDVLATEESAMAEARAHQQCDLAKNRSREEFLSWAIAHLPTRASELRAIRQKRGQLEAAVKYYSRLREALELHRRSMDSLLTASAQGRK